MSALDASTSASAAPSLPPLTAQDLNDLNHCVLTWADSVDQKDWPRFAANLAPTLYIDYRGLGGGAGLHTAMPAADLVASVSRPQFLGRAEIRTQHLVGASSYRRISAEDEIEGTHQLRAAHMVFEDEKLEKLKVGGHGWATNTIWYRRIDGVWKISGVKPQVHGHEDKFHEVMKMAFGGEGAKKEEA